MSRIYPNRRRVLLRAATTCVTGLLNWHRVQQTNVMRFLKICISALLLAFSINAASAHAHLDHSVPAVSSTVTTAPQDVTLTFTQNLESAFSTVEVTDASGARVDQGEARISGNTMQIGLKTLAPGTYTVHWHAVSVDTHKTQGDFSFSVGSQ
jgi:copper resistance protein C